MEVEEDTSTMSDDLNHQVLQKVGENKTLIAESLVGGSMIDSLTAKSSSSSISTNLSMDTDSSIDTIDHQVLQEAGENKTFNAEWSVGGSTLDSLTAKSSNSSITTNILMECCGNPSDTLAGKEQFMVVGNNTKINLNESSFQLDDTRHQSIHKITAFQKRYKLSSHNFSNMFDNIFDDDSQMEVTQNSTSIKPFHKRKRLLPPSDNNDFSISSKSDITGQDSLELSVTSPRLRFSHRNKNNSKANLLNYSMSSVENGFAIDNQEVNIKQKNKNLRSAFKKPTDISSLVVDINTNDNFSVLNKTNLSTNQTISDNSIKVSGSCLNNSTNSTSDVELNSEKTMFNNSLVSNVNQISMCSSIDIPSLNHTYDIRDNCNSTRINSLQVSKSNNTMNINSQEQLNNETYVLENTDNKSKYNTEKSISDSSVTSKKNVLSDTYTVENNKNETYSVLKSGDKSCNNSTKMLHDMSNIYDQPKLSERKPNFIRKLQLGTEVMDYNIVSNDIDDKDNTLCNSVNETGNQSRKFKPKKNLRNTYSATFDNIINKTQDDSEQTMNESVKMSESLNSQQQLSDSILLSSVNQSMVDDETNPSFTKESNILLDAAIEKEITIPESSILFNYNTKGHSSLRRSSSKFNFSRGSRIKDKDLTSTLEVNISSVSCNSAFVNKVSPKRFTDKFEAQDNNNSTISVHSAPDLTSNTSNYETKFKTHNLTASRKNDSLKNGLSQSPARFTNKHSIVAQSEVFNNLIDDSLPSDVSQDMSKRMKFNCKEVLESNSFMFDGIIMDSQETKSVLQNEPVIKQDSPVGETAMAESNICEMSRNKSISCMETEENNESQYQLSSPGLSQTPKNCFVNKPSIDQQSGVFSNLIDDSLDSNDVTQDVSKHIKFNRRNVPDNSFMFDGIITNSQESNTTKSASLNESISTHDTFVNKNKNSHSYVCETDEHFSNESTSGKEAKDCLENQHSLSLSDLSAKTNTSNKFPEPKNTSINNGEVSQRVRKTQSLSKSFSKENKTITDDKSDSDLLNLMNNTTTLPFDGLKHDSVVSDQSIRNDVTGISLDYESSVISRKTRSASKSISNHTKMSFVTNKTIHNKSESVILSLNNTSMFSTASSNMNSDTNNVTDASVSDSALVTGRTNRSASRSFTKENDITMSGVSNKTTNIESESDMHSLNNSSMMSTNSSNTNSDTNNITDASVNDSAPVTSRTTRSASKSFSNHTRMSFVTNKTIHNKSESVMLSLNNTSMFSTASSNMNSDTNNVTDASVSDRASVTGRTNRSASRSFTKENDITMSGVANKTTNIEPESDMHRLNNSSMLSTNSSNINSDTNNITDASVNNSVLLTGRKTRSASKSLVKKNDTIMSHVSNNSATHNKSEYDLLTLNNTSMLSVDISKNSSLKNKKSIPADVNVDKDIISPGIRKTRSLSKSFSGENNISPMSNKTTNDRSEYKLLNLNNADNSIEGKESDINNKTDALLNNTSAETSHKTRSALKNFSIASHSNIIHLTNETITEKSMCGMLSLSKTSTFSFKDFQNNSPTSNKSASEKLESTDRVVEFSVSNSTLSNRKTRLSSKNFPTEKLNSGSCISKKTSKIKKIQTRSSTSSLNRNNRNTSIKHNMSLPILRDDLSINKSMLLSEGGKDNSIVHNSQQLSNVNVDIEEKYKSKHSSTLPSEYLEALINKNNLDNVTNLTVPNILKVDNTNEEIVGKVFMDKVEFAVDHLTKSNNSRQLKNNNSFLSNSKSVASNIITDTSLKLNNSVPIVSENSAGLNVTVSSQDLSHTNNQSSNLTINNTIVSKRSSRTNRSGNSMINNNSLSNSQHINNLSTRIDKDFTTSSTDEVQNKSFSKTVETLNTINTSIGVADLGSTSSPLSSNSLSTQENLMTPDSTFSSKRESKSSTVQSNSVRLTRSLSKKIEIQATISNLSNISVNNVSGTIKSRKTLTQNSSIRKSTRRVQAENGLNPFKTVLGTEKEMSTSLLLSPDDSTSKNSSLNGSVHTQSDDSMLWSTLTDDDTSKISCASNVNGTPVNINKTLAEHINNAIGLMSARKHTTVHPAVFELEIPLTRSFRRISSNGSPSILTRALGKNFSTESLCSSISVSDSIDQQTCVEENITKHFKSLYNKESWITKRLYKFLASKLEPKYNIYSLKYAEKFVKYLASVLKAVRKENVDLQLYTDMLRYHMARYGMIKDTADYIGFLCDYVPKLEFDKLLPGWDLAKSKVKFDPYKTHVPLMEDKEFLNEVLKNLNC